MDKFLNKYRIASTRLQHWDYSWAAAYFITICTKNKEFYFGDVADGEMQLSHVGLLADVFWHEIKHHTKNVDLGAFAVMPNHVHGILILNDDGDSVETRHALSLPAGNLTSGQKRHRFINHWLLQISSDQACQPFRISVWLAGTFSRPYY